MVAVAANFYSFFFCLYTISRPLHDVPVGKSPSWYMGSLFVYVGHDSRTPFYAHGNYLYELLIRTTYTYMYTFTALTTHLRLPLNLPIPALLPPSVYVYRLRLFIYSPHSTYGVKPEVRCSAEAGLPIYVYEYLYELRILIVVDLRGEAGGMLFCCG